VPYAPISGDLEMHVAILGFGLSSQVSAGENGGRTLDHDFVVLGYRNLVTEKNNAGHTASFSLPAVKVDAQRKAIAAWLSAPGDPSPVQVVGGWLEGTSVQ